MMDLHFTQWLRATWLGWLLGLVLTIVAALAGDAVGISGSQSLVGFAMGAGVGIMQARALRGIISETRGWLWSSTIGLATPFLAFDLARLAGFQLPFSLYVCVALGGLVAGLWQTRLLRPHMNKAWLWAPGSIVGWSLAAAIAAAADMLPRALSLRGLPGAGLYLAVTLIGGLILGLVTGLLLVLLHRRQPTSPQSGAARA